MGSPSAQQRPPADQRAAAVASALTLGATGAAVAGTGAALATYYGLNASVLAVLTRLFTRWRYSRVTIRWVLRTVVSVTSSSSRPAGIPGTAELVNARAERDFVAWFLQRAADRIEERVQAGATPDEATAAEDRNLQLHLDAQRKRREAATRVDVEANKPGQVVDPADPQDPTSRPRVILLWRAHPDDRVTPECRAADGAWFYADTPPVIGYPGMPHGGTCRCWPGNAGSLEAVARGRTVDEAVRAIIGSEPDHRPHPGSGDGGSEDERQAS